MKKKEVKFNGGKEFEELQDQSSSLKNKELARVHQPWCDSRRRQETHRREFMVKTKEQTLSSTH